MENNGLVFATTAQLQDEPLSRSHSSIAELSVAAAATIDTDLIDIPFIQSIDEQKNTLLVEVVQSMSTIQRYCIVGC